MSKHDCPTCGGGWCSADRPRNPDRPALTEADRKAAEAALQPGQIQIWTDDGSMRDEPRSIRRLREDIASVFQKEPGSLKTTFLEESLLPYCYGPDPNGYFKIWLVDASAVEAGEKLALFVHAYSAGARSNGFGTHLIWYFVRFNKGEG